MEIMILKAKEEDQEIIQNLGRFYVYDMSRYCGFLEGWQTPSNGLYESFSFSRYWEEPHRYPFLVHVDNELAGFVLVNKIGSTPEIDWNMAEFFIVAKFQGKGIGRDVAEKIFSQFRGKWEVMQIPENKGAIAFWEKVVDQYTSGNFKKYNKNIEEPKPHPMLILQFTARAF